jgi:hypothetical protein
VLQAFQKHPLPPFSISYKYLLTNLFWIVRLFCFWSLVGGVDNGIVVGQHPFRLSILGKGNPLYAELLSIQGDYEQTVPTTRMSICVSEQLGTKRWPAWRSRTVSSIGLENVACSGVRTIVTVSHGRGTRTGR